MNLVSTQVLTRHYERIESETEGKKHSQVRFKANQELAPAAEAIESPYDMEARFRSRYETAWTGYLVHLSETCDDDDVHLISHVETTPATVYESHQTQAIQQALIDKYLPPLNIWLIRPASTPNCSSIVSKSKELA